MAKARNTNHRHNSWITFVTSDPTITIRLAPWRATTWTERGDDGLTKLVADVELEWAEAKASPNGHMLKGLDLVGALAPVADALERGKIDWIVDAPDPKMTYLEREERLIAAGVTAIF